jgi:hypothetical protein
MVQMWFEITILPEDRILQSAVLHCCKIDIAKLTQVKTHRAGGSGFIHGGIGHKPLVRHDQVAVLEGNSQSMIQTWSWVRLRR